MEERIWARRDDTPMRFTARKTSEDRYWTGFEAALYDATDGYSEMVFAEHTVSMHVGAPVLAQSQCDGKILRRYHVQGDIKIVPAGFYRIWETEAPASKLSVFINPSLVRTTADAMGISSDAVSIVPELHLVDPQIEHILWALKAELETDESFGRLYADSLGMALTAHLLRRYAPVAPRRTDGGLPKARLQRVMDYVHNRLAQDLSLAELADVANVSPSHFTTLFKQSVGLPFHQYLIRSRVEYAMNLLVGGDMPLSQVALAAGFANQSHMARCMRKLTGMTPGAVRKAH